MSKGRRRHTAEQKAELLRQHVAEKKPVSEVCNEAEIQPSLFSHGKGSYWLEPIRCFRSVVRRAVRRS